MVKSLKVIPEAGECCPNVAKLRPRPARQYTKLFKALGDETRLEILGLLAAAPMALCVCDIESHFNLSQPTVSHHIKLLREAGLIKGERRANWIYYRIEHKTLAQLPLFRALLHA